MNPQTQTDKQALDLTHAIALTESGSNGKPNYNATGASGEKGGYQWLPGHFESGAKAAGLDPTDFSPTNQDKVAYFQVKQYKDKGYDPGQISSLWNSGSPDNWQNHSGTNKQGVAYDTPAYVNKVKANYQKLSQNNSQGFNPNPYSNPDKSPGSFDLTGTSATGNTTTPQTSFMDKALGVAKDVGKSIEAPFVSLAALPVQGLAKLTGQPDPYATFDKQTGLAPVTSSDQPLGSFVEKELGNAAQVGSYALPGEGILGAAGMGALQGGGSAMSAGGNATNVLGGAAIGAATGGLIGGATKLAGKGLSVIGGAISGEAANKATEEIKNAYGSALNLNASERAFEQRSGKDLANILMQNKAPLGRYANGTLDASGAITKLQAPLDTLNAQAEQILSHPQGVVHDISLSDTLAQVKKRIQNLTVSQAEKNTAIAHANQLFKAEVSQFGESVTPDVADKIKQGMWGSSFKGKLIAADKLQGDVSYLAGNTLKTSIEKSVAGTDAGNVLGAINQQRGDLVDALKRLSNLDGQRLLKGGRLGNMAGGIAGTIIGASTGNPLAALGGDVFGTRVAEFLNNPATKIGAAELKQKASGLIPGLLGKSAKPIGGAISKVGGVVQKLPRLSGLISNAAMNVKPSR